MTGLFLILRRLNYWRNDGQKRETNHFESWNSIWSISYRRPVTTRTPSITLMRADNVRMRGAKKAPCIKGLRLINLYFKTTMKDQRKTLNCGYRLKEKVEFITLLQVRICRKQTFKVCPLLFSIIHLWWKIKLYGIISQCFKSLKMFHLKPEVNNQI